MDALYTTHHNTLNFLASAREFTLDQADKSEHPALEGTVRDFG